MVGLGPLPLLCTKGVKYKTDVYRKEEEDGKEKKKSLVTLAQEKWY